MLIVPQNHGYYMCIAAQMSLMSATYAMRRGHYMVAIGPLGVWFNSVNFWRNPCYGFRRNLDICWLLGALTTQMLNSHHSRYCNYYRCIMLGSLLFYPVGWVLYINEYFWSATITHSMLHLFPNVANIILYSGL